MEKKEITIKDVITKGKRNNKNIDSNKIYKAYEYAKDKHKNQFRKSGEPYIIHPVNVAYILTELGMDTETICAGLLHDVVEDTDTTYEDIKENFGDTVANLVEGVTKLSDLFKTIEEKQTENYKKLFSAMEKDIRIIILKLADRLHNISTLKFLKRDRQIAIATETVELYAPIAHKLGMYDMKMKLQDGSFKYLYPDEYERINNELDKKKKENIEYIEKTKDKIRRTLIRYRVVAKLQVENKHIYNLYKKMKEKNLDIDQVKDLFDIKIIARTKSDCYKILGIINTLYKVMPKTFKDYVATPRNNYYQAIQEIIIGESGTILEVQICSQDMNKIARYGIINSLKDIEKINRENNENIDFQKNLVGIHESLELENIIENPKEFLKTLKEELIDGEIYIFTPKGDIKVLPKNSCVIDFAYSISEKVGDHITGCKINNIDKPILSTLKNGDIVQIELSENTLIPNYSWNENIKTAKAKINLLKLIENESKNKDQTRTITIKAKDKREILCEIIKSLTENKIDIISFNTETKENEIEIKAIIKVEEESKLEEAKNSIYNIKEVLKLEVI